MVWIAIVLGIFLFYRFVDRKHKVVALKACALVSILAVLGIGGYLGYSKWKSLERENGIRVSYIGRDFDRDRRKEDAVEKAFQIVLPSVLSDFGKISASEYELVKSILFSGWIGTDSSDTSAVKRPAPYNIEISNAEYKALFVTFEDNSSEAKDRLRDIEVERANKMVRSIPTLRARSGTGLNKFLFASHIDQAIHSFSSSAAKKVFEDALDVEDRSLRSTYNGVWKKAQEHLDEVVNESPLTLVKMSFRICNKRKIPLKSYSFYVSGLREGRSAKNAVRKSESGLIYTKIDGDIIVAPESCESITYTGDFKFFDRYEVSLASGRWDE